MIFIALWTAPVSCNSGQNSAKEGAVREHELPEAARRDWMLIKNEWMRNGYSECLKEFGLKMKCSGCEYVFIKVELSVDTDGRLTGCRKINDNVCGRSATVLQEECLLRRLKSMVFPQSLRGKKFETMLGTGLSC